MPGLYGLQTSKNYSYFTIIEDLRTGERYSPPPVGQASAKLLMDAFIDSVKKAFKE